MSDNVVKFRKIKKKPEPKPRKPFNAQQIPNWVYWALLVGVALIVYWARRSGWL